MHKPSPLALQFLVCIFLFFNFIQPALAEEAERWVGELNDGSKITEDDLQRLLTAHKKWLDRDSKISSEEGRLDLSRATLFRVNLSGAELSEANLADADLSYADLSGADLSHAILSNAYLTNTSLSKADMSHANLEGAMLGDAILFEANLFNANLSDANLSGADLFKAKLSKTNLSRANLSKADLGKANLTGANLNDAILHTTHLCDANLTGTQVNNIILNNSDLRGATYESIVGVPAKNFLGQIHGIETLKYETKDGYSGLALLRNALKDVGLHDLERQATYAIEKGKLHHMPWMGDDELTLSNLFTIINNCFERGFRTVLFLWPCDFGMHPGRPLWILVSLIPAFAVFYYRTICHPLGKGGIYQVWVADRQPKYIGTDEPQRLHASGWTAVKWAGYFSILSACRIGWRELNPGSWIVNMQRQEYLLKPTGWVRTISGLQALISVYLLALAVLTYFGRPFE